MGREVVKAAPPRQTRELPPAAAEPPRIDAATTVAAGVLSAILIPAAPAPTAEPAAPAVAEPAPVPTPPAAAPERAAQPEEEEAPVEPAAIIEGGGNESTKNGTSQAPETPRSVTAIGNGAQLETTVKAAAPPVERAAKTPTSPKNQVVFLASDVVRRRLKMFTVRDVQPVAVSSVIAYAVDKLLDAMTDDEIASRVAALGHGLRRGKGPTTDNPLYLPGSKKNQVAFTTTDAVKRRLRMFTVRDVDAIAEGMVVMFAVGRLFESMLDDEIAAHVAAIEEASARARIAPA